MKTFPLYAYFISCLLEPHKHQMYRPTSKKVYPPHRPHQGEREKTRRRQQIARGIIFAG